MKEDYSLLLDVLLRCIESNKGVESGSDGRILVAESLAIKLFKHSATIKYLYEGTPIVNAKFRFFDLASLNVIARTIIENYLVFHYIFIQPQDNEDGDFRYYSYRLSGLIERQTFAVQSPQGNKMLSEELKIIEKLIIQLNSNQYFLKLSKEYREKIIKRGEWRLLSWKEIGLTANLSESIAKDFYKYLCGYSHSGNLSAIQLHETLYDHKEKPLFDATLSLIKIAIANMILSYSQYFPKVQTFYDNLGDIQKLVKLWIDVGSSNMDNVDVDWSELKL
jgi:hypothetical protein